MLLLEGLNCYSCGDVQISQEYKLEYFCLPCYNALAKQDCDYCGAEFSDDYEAIYNGIVCRECADEHYFTCESCEELKDNDESCSVQIRYNREQTWCEDCVDSNTYCCSGCPDAWADSSDYILWHGDYYCPNCQENIGTCEVCDEYYWCEDGQCCDDTGGALSDYIGGSEYDATRKGFYNIGALDSAPLRYLGAEIEVSYDGDTPSDDADSIYTILGSDKFIYTADCSLERGVEIVSCPMTLDYWTDEMASRMKEFYSQFHDLSLTTYQAGLHIHVSRDAVTFDGLLALGRLIYDNNEFQAFLKKVSRRDGNFYYCPFDCARAFQNASCDERAETNGEKFVLVAREKYAALNVAHDATLEFRFMAGARTYEQFMAALELVDAMVGYCNSVYNRNDASFGLDGFLSYVLQANGGRYSHLLAVVESYIASYTAPAPTPTDWAALVIAQIDTSSLDAYTRAENIFQYRDALLAAIESERRRIVSERRIARMAVFGE